jgi:SWI/SNF related-matrix-associated actin-dependent regulator of chromatin subfamily C
MDRLNFQRRVRALEDATKKIASGASGMQPDEAMEKLAEAMRMFGVGKGEESMGTKRDSVDDGVQPVAEGTEGYSKMEI